MDKDRTLSIHLTTARKCKDNLSYKVWSCMPLIPAFMTQRQVDLFKFEAIMVYTTISRPARPAFVRLCLKRKQNKTKMIALLFLSLVEPNDSPNSQNLHLCAESPSDLQSPPLPSQPSFHFYQGNARKFLGRASCF